MALKQPLSHIEKVDLREVWANEAYDFTQWLAEEENLNALGEVIGIDLELIETESPVGSFSADIYAMESDSNRRVIIENQLEETDHKHLGQIITYAAGKGAQLVVWIVAKANDQHKQAIEWLNEHTDSEFGFFLIEIEVLKIGDSMAAPRFNIVEQPNDWAKAIKQSESLSEGKKLYLQYWQRYEQLAKHDFAFMKVFSPRKPRPQSWTSLKVGTSRYRVSLAASTQNKTVSVELYVPDEKETGQRAIDNISTFEEIIGVKGVPFVASKVSGIRFFRDHSDLSKEQEWDTYIERQLGKAILLRDAINKLEL